MREWLSGGVSPCQGEGRGFESRLALFLLGLRSNPFFMSKDGILHNIISFSILYLRRNIEYEIL